MIRALCAFVVLILIMAIRPAPAATIEAKGHIIEIKGDIDHGDFDKFSAKLGAAPDAKIVSGDKSELKPGAKIFISAANKKEDGTLEAAAISVGRDGITPPM
jgi:hypothetical protein